MKKFARVAFRILKGIYDILATYLLLFLVPFCVVAVPMWFLTGQVATYLELETRDALWSWLSARVGLPELWLRLGATLPVHAAVWWLMRRPTAVVMPHLERAFDAFVRVFKRVTARVPRLQIAAEAAFSLAVTLVLVPFVVQPTLVPTYDAPSWAVRAANFADGTASMALADSVVGWYRIWFADPVVAPPVSQAAIDQAVDQSENQPNTPPVPTGKEPLMDRWDPALARVAEGDAMRFANLKAFMWVESAGRQYAVSHTGCAGLMQFCAGTARAKPFKEVFGTGQVYVCACKDKRCQIPREMQRDLESGDPAALSRHATDFPCQLTDARFNPDKILTAGDLYIRQLAESFGGNVYLMYIGYNSGPSISRRVWEKVGRNPDATLEDIEVHLADAMRQTYGDAADARARSLVRTHLPKLKRAQQKYLQQGAIVVPQHESAPDTVVTPAPEPPDAGHDVTPDAHRPSA